MTHQTDAKPDADPESPETPPDGRPTLVFRCASAAYLLFLTTLLLVPDPEEALRIPRLFDLGAHFAAFSLLGFLMMASRLSLSAGVQIGTLACYAIGIELLQFFSPQRVVQWLDLLENLLGLLAGGAAWLLFANWRSFSWRNNMSSKEEFRVKTREGLLSNDTFVIADRQPRGIKPGCVLMLHETTGKSYTVHRTRLVSAGDQGVLSVDRHHKSVCLKCGHVEGVVQDEVACPEHGDRTCGLVEDKR